MAWLLKISLQVTKSGSFMIMFKVKGHGSTKMNLQSLPPAKKSYAMCMVGSLLYGSFWDFLTGINYSMQTSTLNSCNTCHENLCKRPVIINWRNVVVLRIMQGHIQQELLRKILETLGIIFSRPYTRWFPYFSFSTKCSEWQKISQEQVKMFAENLLSSKPAEFYLRGINKQHDKW